MTNYWKKGIIVIFLILISFYFLLVIIHELGHIVFGAISGFQFVAIELNFPYFFAQSYVIMAKPIGANSTLFLLGGTLFTVIIGFILTLLSTIYPKVIGWFLMIDGMFYPVNSLITGTGDFAKVHISFIPFFYFMTLGLYIVSIYRYFNLRRSKSLGLTRPK